MSDRIRRMRKVLEQRLGWVRVAVEAVHHRHNVSAILRTCDAMGIHHVHLVEGHFVPAKGAARGADRWLDIHWEQDAGEAIRALQEQGFSVWVADLDDDSASPETLPLDRPVVIWLGAELVGVSPEARAAADGVLTVPMRGFAQSLNVSVAAALSIRPVAERARAQHGDAALLPADEREAVWDHWLARERELRSGVDARNALSDRTPPRPEDPDGSR